MSEDEEFYDEDDGFVYEFEDEFPSDEELKNAIIDGNTYDEVKERLEKELSVCVERLREWCDTVDIYVSFHSNNIDYTFFEEKHSGNAFSREGVIRHVFRNFIKN